MGNQPSLEDQVFDLKFNAKQMARESARQEKEMNKHKATCKKYMAQGNMDVAKVYAENAIRAKKTSLNMLKMSARMDAVAGRLNAMAAQQNLSKTMQGVVASMGVSMKQMDLANTSLTMDKFESLFEDLDVNLKAMETSMGTVTQSGTPETEVADLMMQVADQNNLQMDDKFAEIGIGRTEVQGQQQEVKQSEKSMEQQLEDRLANI